MAGGDPHICVLSADTHGYYYTGRTHDTKKVFQAIFWFLDVVNFLHLLCSCYSSGNVLSVLCLGHSLPELGEFYCFCVTWIVILLLILDSLQLPWLELDGYVALKVLSYYIILFPSLDVISAYPLNNATIANNVYIIITGRDSTDDKRRYVKLFLLLLKFICAVLPLALAFAVSNLLYVVEYAGLLGFAICHLYPAMLQFASQYHCMKVFGGSTCSINASDEGAPLLGKAKKGNFLKNWWLTWKNPAYWTPHSTFISHPISVSIICVICLILFGLSVGSFFVPS